MNLHKIELAKKMNDLSIRDIAKIIEKSKTPTALRLNGERPFTVPEAKKLADHFGVTVDELFFGEMKDSFLAKVVPDNGTKAS